MAYPKAPVYQEAPLAPGDGELQMLLQAVSTCSGLAVQNILTHRPELLNKKGVYQGRIWVQIEFTH